MLLKYLIAMVGAILIRQSMAAPVPDSSVCLDVPETNGDFIPAFTDDCRYEEDE